MKPLLVDTKIVTNFSKNENKKKILLLSYYQVKLSLPEFYQIKILLNYCQTGKISDLLLLKIRPYKLINKFYSNISNT